MTSVWHWRWLRLACHIADALCAQLECGEFKQLRTFGWCFWNILHCLSIWIFKWRASLVPAAAVIPAPLAYTIIVAVKRLVVGLNTTYYLLLFLFKVNVHIYYFTYMIYKNSVCYTHIRSCFFYLLYVYIYFVFEDFFPFLLLGKKFSTYYMLYIC